MISDNQAVALAFVFGVAYNALISWFRGRGDPKTAPVALEVVVGVLIVLVIASLIRADKHYVWGDAILTNGQSAAWIVLRCFVGAGIPMFAGSIWRQVKSLS